jgi:hypothetical protein
MSKLLNSEPDASYKLSTISIANQFSDREIGTAIEDYVNGTELDGLFSAASSKLVISVRKKFDANIQINNLAANVISNAFPSTSAAFATLVQWVNDTLATRSDIDADKVALCEADAWLLPIAQIMQLTPAVNTGINTLISRRNNASNVKGSINNPATTATVKTTSSSSVLAV